MLYHVKLYRDKQDDRYSKDGSRVPGESTACMVTMGRRPRFNGGHIGDTIRCFLLFLERPSSAFVFLLFVRLELRLAIPLSRR